MSVAARLPLLVLVAGCGDDRPVLVETLVEGEPLTVGVIVSRTSLDRPGRVLVEASVGSQTPDQCLALESLGAVLAGRQPTEISLGYGDGPFWFDPRVDFTIDLDPPIASAQLILADRSRTIRVEVGDALLPRRGTLVAPADRLIVAGDRVELDWSSPSDLTTGQLTVELRRWAQIPETEVIYARAEAGRIVADVPGDLPFFSGEGELCARWLANALPTPCDVASCQLYSDHAVCIPVRFVSRR